MPDAPTHPAHAPLLQAGRTLATLAEPGKDITAFASDLHEIALTIKCLATGLDKADERAEDRYDAILEQGERNFIGTPRLSAYERARIARDTDKGTAIRTAGRTLKRALIDLARVIGEIEMQATASDGESDHA